MNKITISTEATLTGVLYIVPRSPIAMVLKTCPGCGVLTPRPAGKCKMSSCVTGSKAS